MAKAKPGHNCPGPFVFLDINMSQRNNLFLFDNSDVRKGIKLFHFDILGAETLEISTLSESEPEIFDLSDFLRVVDIDYLINMAHLPGKRRRPPRGALKHRPGRQY